MLFLVFSALFASTILPADDPAALLKQNFESSKSALAAGDLQAASRDYDRTIALGLRQLANLSVSESRFGGPHNLIAKYPGDAVLTASDSSGTPTTVTIMDYVVQVFPSALAIQDGFSGTAAFNFTPLGGFAQPVQLSCGKLPANVSCSFSKTSVTLDGVNPSVVTLTINTVGTVAKLDDSHGMWPASSAFVLAGLLLPFGLRKRFKFSRAALYLIFLALCGAGCGRGSKTYNSNVAAAGSYTINVTATSGGAPAGKAVPLTVTILR